MGGLKGGEKNDDKKRRNCSIWAARNLERTWLQSCNRGSGHSRYSGSIGETRVTTSRIDLTRKQNKLLTRKEMKEIVSEVLFLI